MYVRLWTLMSKKLTEKLRNLIRLIKCRPCWNKLNRDYLKRRSKGKEVSAIRRILNPYKKGWKRSVNHSDLKWEKKKLKRLLVKTEKGLLTRRGLNRNQRMIKRRMTKQKMIDWLNFDLCWKKNYYNTEYFGY